MILRLQVMLEIDTDQKSAVVVGPTQALAATCPGICGGNPLKPRYAFCSKTCRGATLRLRRIGKELTHDQTISA